jgi:hypothetical protein
MRRLAFGAACLLAFLLGPAVSWSLPASAQPYKTAPAAEATPPAGEAPGAMRVPRRRPATAEEVKPAVDPALTDQCSWIGKRIISLLVRDDAMAADDFSPFYVKFGCPEPHLSKAFGCLVANLLTMENSALADQADECWRDPNVRYVPVNDGKSPIEPSRAKGDAPAGAPPVPPRSN